MFWVACILGCNEGKPVCTKNTCLSTVEINVNLGHTLKYMNYSFLFDYNIEDQKCGHQFELTFLDDDFFDYEITHILSEGPGDICLKFNDFNGVYDKNSVVLTSAVTKEKQDTLPNQLNYKVSSNSQEIQAGNLQYEKENHFPNGEDCDKPEDICHKIIFNLDIND